MAKRVFLVWLALFLVTACDAPKRTTAPSLRELPLEPDVKASGLRLMAAPNGLHTLADSASPTGIVAVHGADSRGYEWIYALHEFEKKGVRVYFMRYDHETCPDLVARELATALDTLLAKEAGLTRLRLVGHSYGGVVSALVAARYRGRVPLDVELVAAPLAGFESLRTRCKYEPAQVQTPAANVSVSQWRTRQELDNAFRDLPVDPQRIDIAGARVVQLGTDYRGQRLGHNWSISAVADQLP